MFGEVREDESRDEARSRGVCLVKCTNGLVCVHVFGGDPFVSVLSIAFPSDEVLELSAQKPGVKDGFDFPFLFAVYNVRWRWG